MTSIKISKISALWLIASFAVSLSAFAQASLPNSNEMLKPTLADCSWLVGDWDGNGLGGISQESWAPTQDGAMMGMFRQIQDDKIEFYEFFILIETASGLELRIKHFHNSLKGWEEKDEFVTFPLLTANENEIAFEGLIYRRKGEKSMEVELDISRDGKTEKVFFNFVRKG